MRAIALVAIVLAFATLAFAQGPAPPAFEDALEKTLDEKLWHRDPESDKGPNIDKGSLLIPDGAYVFSRQKWAAKKASANKEKKMEQWFRTTLTLEFLLPEQDSRLAVLLHCNARIDGKSRLPHDALQVEFTRKSVAVQIFGNKKAFKIPPQKIDELQLNAWHSLRIIDDPEVEKGKISMELNGRRAGSFIYDKKLFFVGDLFGFAGNVRVKNVKRTVTG